MSERDGYEPGVPCWVDTWRHDPEPAVRFYSGVLGWEAEETTPPDAPRRYFMCRLRGRDVAAVGAPAPDGSPPAWTTYVWVDSADAAAAKARAAGGSVLAEPFASLDGGRMALLADRAGAAFGVWEPGSHRGAQLVNEPGAYAMSFLQTGDPEGAKAFYGAVFGWETEMFGPITMWRLPGYVGGEPQQPVSRDVVATMLHGDQPAAWAVNFWVGDIDVAVERAGELGGRVVMGPADSPVGKDAMIADPDGGVLSISEILVP